MYRYVSDVWQVYETLYLFILFIDVFITFKDFTTSMGMCGNVAGIDEMQLECWRSNTIMMWLAPAMVVNLIKDVE